ncbi:hypothetical protein [Saccharopolyspora sp. 5N708]|uniref:hypothetical protein n=1 Tax=Saccharopolyspora sp. 5N708 TaxID=3457424 RepID=UPI003FCFC396
MARRDNWTFTDWMNELVRVSEPRTFALVEEIEDRFGRDGELIAWGMQFDDHAELVGADGCMRGTFASAQSAVDLFSQTAKIHLIWHSPA